MPDPKPSDSVETPAVPVQVGDLTGPLIDGMPEPTEQIQQPTSTSPVHGPDTESGRKDPAGNVWDPSIHEDPPRLNVEGTWAKLRGKRKPVAVRFSVSSPVNRPADGIAFAGVENTGIPGQPAEKPRLSPEGVANMAIPMMDRIGRVLLTEEAALTDSDREMIRPMVVEYVNAAGVRDIPPGWALLAGIVTVYADKCSKPTVRERLALYWLKIRGFFGGKNP